MTTALAAADSATGAVPVKAGPAPMLGTGAAGVATRAAGVEGADGVGVGVGVAVADRGAAVVGLGAVLVAGAGAAEAAGAGAAERDVAALTGDALPAAPCAKGRAVAELAALGLLAESTGTATRGGAALLPAEDGGAATAPAAAERAGCPSATELARAPSGSSATISLRIPVHGNADQPREAVRHLRSRDPRTHSSQILRFL